MNECYWDIPNNPLYNKNTGKTSTPTTPRFKCVGIFVTGVQKPLKNYVSLRSLPSVTTGPSLVRNLSHESGRYLSSGRVVSAPRHPGSFSLTYREVRSLPTETHGSQRTNLTSVPHRFLSVGPFWFVR